MFSYVLTIPRNWVDRQCWRSSPWSRTPSTPRARRASDEAPIRAVLFGRSRTTNTNKAVDFITWRIIIWTMPALLSHTKSAQLKSHHLESWTCTCAKSTAQTTVDSRYFITENHQKLNFHGEHLKVCINTINSSHKSPISVTVYSKHTYPIWEAF